VNSALAAASSGRRRARGRHRRRGDPANDAADPQDATCT